MKGKQHSSRSLKGKFPNGLRAAMEHKGYGPSELARLVPTSPQNVQRWRDGERELTRYWAEKLAPLLDRTPQELIFGDETPRSIPIVGRIGDLPNEVVTFDDSRERRILVASIPGTSHNTVAVEVLGDLMRGIAEDNWVFLYDEGPSQPTEEMIGEVCVVRLEDGKTYVKILERGSGPGLYDLKSMSFETIKNQKIAFATLVRAFIPRVVARKLTSTTHSS